jgi:hypothetical protein
MKSPSQQFRSCPPDLAFALVQFLQGRVYDRRPSCRTKDEIPAGIRNQNFEWKLSSVTQTWYFSKKIRLSCASVYVVLRVWHTGCLPEKFGQSRPKNLRACDAKRRTHFRRFVLVGIVLTQFILNQRGAI